MRRTLVTSTISVVGRMWLPNAVAATDITCNVENLLYHSDKTRLANLTRDDVADWLTMHSGDFSQVLDFRADLSWQDQDRVIDWQDEDSEAMYFDCMYPNEED